MLLQLPPKRRQIIRLLLKRSDVVAAKTAVGKLNGNTFKNASEQDITLGTLDEPDGIAAQKEVEELNSDASRSDTEDINLESLDEFDGTGEEFCPHFSI